MEMFLPSVIQETHRVTHVYLYTAVSCTIVWGEETGLVRLRSTVLHYKSSGKKQGEQQVIGLGTHLK